MHQQTTRALLTAFAAQPSMTGLSPLLASIAWELDTLAGEDVCDAGEWAMRRRYRKNGQRGKAAVAAGKAGAA